MDLIKKLGIGNRKTTCLEAGLNGGLLVNTFSYTTICVRLKNSTIFKKGSAHWPVFFNSPLNAAPFPPPDFYIRWDAALSGGIFLYKQEMILF